MNFKRFLLVVLAISVVMLSLAVLVVPSETLEGVVTVVVYLAVTLPLQVGAAAAWWAPPSRPEEAEELPPPVALPSRAQEERREREAEARERAARAWAVKHLRAGARVRGLWEVEVRLRRERQAWEERPEAEEAARTSRRA